MGGIHIFKISNYKIPDVYYEYIKVNRNKKGMINLASNEMISQQLTQLNKEMNLLLTTKDINRYPFFSNNYEYEKRITKSLNLANDNILFASGSDSVIYLLLSLLRKKTKTIISQFPNFDNYLYYAYLHGYKLFEWNMNKNTYNFKINEYQDNFNDGIICITNPNSFSGSCLKMEEIKWILKNAKHNNKLVLLDIVYSEYSSLLMDEYKELCYEYLNLIIINSFSKSHGLAGARIAYVYSNPEIIKYLKKWNFNNTIDILSYQICLLILENYKYELQKIREQIINNRKILLNILTNKNLQAFDSEGNFILVNLKSEKEKEKVRMALSKNRLLVRDFNKNTMLNTCLRITIPEGKEFNKVANFFHYNI